MSQPPWHDRAEPEHIPRIRALFAERLPSQMKRVRRHESTLLEGGWDPDSAEATHELFRIVHCILGTAEALGGERVGDAAFAIAEALRDHRDGTVPLPEPSLRDLPPLIDELEESTTEFLAWVRLDLSASTADGSAAEGP